MWQTPKTDWKASDFMNIEDYNRIKNNLNELRDMSRELWKEFPFEEMGEDKTYTDYGFYADEINRFEANVDHICDGTYPFDVGVRKNYQDNQPFITWEELNRIESACLIMHNNFTGALAGRKSLAFTLGGGDFRC